MQPAIIAALVAIGGVVFTALFTATSALCVVYIQRRTAMRVEEQKDQLQYVDKQLEALYGPVVQFLVHLHALGPLVLLRDQEERRALPDAELLARIKSYVVDEAKKVLIVVQSGAHLLNIAEELDQPGVKLVYPYSMMMTIGFLHKIIFKSERYFGQSECIKLLRTESADLSKCWTGRFKTLKILQAELRDKISQLAKVPRRTGIKLTPHGKDIEKAKKYWKEVYPESFVHDNRVLYM